MATERLRPHAGRTLALTLAGWPALLPPPPALAWRVTPAGLLEWCGAAARRRRRPTWRCAWTPRNPALLLARMLGGEPPPVQIDGDAQLAGDVNWLLQNLRWDVAADLERLFGPVVAQQLHQVGRTHGRRRHARRRCAHRRRAAPSELRSRRGLNRPVTRRR